MKIIEYGELGSQLGPLTRGEPRVVASGNLATPWAVLAEVDAALPSYRLFVLNAQVGMPERDGVVHETPFVGPGVRCSPRLKYMPCRLSLVPRLFAHSHPPDLVLLHTTPPRNGRVSLGIEVNILPAAIEQARMRGARVVAQLNPQMPWTYGDAETPVELIDLAVEVDSALPSPDARPIGEVEAHIGSRVAELVSDGATLQMGIGAVPDAILASLSGHRGLRVWSEMFSDGMVALDQAGALDRDEMLVASFLFGSPWLYAWLHDNPRVRLLRTEITNDPSLIAQQNQMTSINGALEVDLFGQANASWIDGEIYSGFGGQPDFVVGALHAPRGQSVIALPSWHAAADRSTIVPSLTGPATSFQHSWVVTEQGAAQIWPRSAAEQARNLINVAHPDARSGLRAAVAVRERVQS